MDTILVDFTSSVQDGIPECLRLCSPDRIWLVWQSDSGIPKKKLKHSGEWNEGSPQAWVQMNVLNAWSYGTALFGVPKDGINKICKVEDALAYAYAGIVGVGEGGVWKAKSPSLEGLGLF